MSGFPKIILLFATVDWPIFMRRKMAYGLARAARSLSSTVVAINRPLCPFSTIFKKPKRMIEFFEAPRLEKLDDNLFLFSPRYAIHDNLGNRLEVLEKLNMWCLRRTYKYLCRKLQIREPAPMSWYHHPHQGYITGLFKDGFSVFEIYDNLARFDGCEDEFAKRLESKIRSQVNLFLATSPKLLDRYGRYYKTAWLSGNCLDRETFQRLTRKDIAGLPELLKIPSPRIGYTGIISKRLDWNLVGEIARLRPQWNIIFVGHVRKDEMLKSIYDLDNVHFPGFYDHSLMPSVLGSLDVGFMPYLDNDFFGYSNPLKFYEFAAAGLRSVSSNMEVLSIFPSDFVRIVPNEAMAWISALDELLKLDKFSAREIGTEIASKYIWEDMYKDILGKISEQFFS